MSIILIKALQLILCLSLLVILHEFGHFGFSKLFHVKVTRFYLFYNPASSPISRTTRRSTASDGCHWADTCR